MEDSYYLQPPKDQKFYRLFALFSSLTAVSRETWWGYDLPFFKRIIKFNNLMVYILAPCIFVSQIAYLVKNYSDLTSNVKSIMFAIIPVSGLVNIVLISANQNSFKKVMKNFMGKIHLCNLEVQDEYVKMKRIRAEKLTRLASYFMIGLLMLDWLAWLMITGLNNYHNRDEIQNKTKRLETVVYPLVPFDYEYNFNNWIFIHIFNVYLVWTGCIIVALHFSTNYPFIFQLIGHIDILKHKIETEFDGIFTQEEVRTKLVGIIKYHSFILNIFREIQNAFGLNVTAFYFYNLLADSLNLYQLMMADKGSAMTYGLMVVVYVGGLVMMSFVLEEIRRQSDGLADAVYNIDWELMSIANRKMVLLLLMRIQPALQFTAAGGLKAGVKPMIAIARTSFSIYVMLKSSMNS